MLLVMAAELASGPGAISAALEFYGAPEEDARVVEEVPSGAMRSEAEWRGAAALIEVKGNIIAASTPLRQLLPA